MDLEREISATKAEDIRVVYQGLLAGSRKHLRSYVGDLQDQGIQYEPKYLSQKEFEDECKGELSRQSKTMRVHLVSPSFYYQ